jgi:hypothetical protein
MKPTKESVLQEINDLMKEKEKLQKKLDAIASKLRKLVYQN